VTSPLLVRCLGLQPYLPVWEAMRRFTRLRDERTPSELWLLQHPPVYTLGQAGKVEHLLSPGDIPVLHIDRGGQVTYHGPGQLLAYLLLDLKETGTGVRGLVQGMEDAVISLLGGQGIVAHARREAPGVYVAGAKIAALGLRVRKGYCYHGLSLNVDLDLEPFSRINPCGYQGLAVTSLRQLGCGLSIGEIQGQLSAQLCARLGYTAQDAAGRLPV